MRALLFLLFFVLLTAETLNLDLSLAPGLSVKNAMLYLILVGIAINTALYRNRSFEAGSVIVPYALCIAYALFTWVTILLIIDYPGYERFYSLIVLKNGLADHLIVFLVFFYGVLNAKDALWLIKALIWTVLIVNVISVMDALNLPDLGLVHEREDGRIGGPIGESNQYAVFISLFLPGILALAIMGRGWIRYAAFLGACVSALALMLTASRGGTLGLVGGSLLACVFLRRFIPFRVAALGAFGALFFVFAGVLMAYLAGYGELLYDRFIQDSIGGGHEVSSGRTTIWTKALALMFDQPVTLITGYGWNAYSAFRPTGFAPHNTYLGIFFGLGIIGLFFVLLAYGNVLRIARAAMRVAERESLALLMAFSFGFLAVLVGIFFVELAQPWVFIWAYTGISLRLAITTLEQHPDSSPEAERSGPMLVTGRRASA